VRLTNDKLDLQNGRLRKVETDVAVLKSKQRTGLLPKLGAGLGSLIAGAAYWWSQK
jgi:hypothetical protein